MVVFTIISTGCKKDFLDIKPSTQIIQPTSLEEFQKLLDNTEIMNVGIGLGILASDEYAFSSDLLWQSSFTALSRNSYIWSKDLYEGEPCLHWNLPYSTIFYANNIVSGLEKIEVTNLNNKEWSRVRASALFVRAFSYHDLVSNFSNTYDATTSATDLGVPIRLKPSVDELRPRSTVKENFDQILLDLSIASQLFNNDLPSARTRPSKAAVHALLSRVYLSMREYALAELHSDSCLLLYNKLIDYKTLNKTATAPFGNNHDEQIYARLAIADGTYTSIGNNTSIEMSKEIISMYEPNDLRLPIYFSKQLDGTYDPKRTYYGNGGAFPFVGLATDEIYLIKAECLARRNEVSESMKFLNQLKIKRWDANATIPAKPFQEIISTTPEEALAAVLIERQKELVWRGLRWTDLKRLNKEGAAITLTRTVNSNKYTLAPNDKRYVFPIPDNEVSLSGIPQNPR